MAKPEAALKKAIKQADLATVKQIIAAGLPVDSLLPAKVTALEFALAQEQHEIAWELVRLGARPRKQKQDNLLLDVPKFRDLKLLRQLVELGADIHACDRGQQSPLLCAVSAGFYDGVHYLLEQGGDPRARDSRDNSAFTRIDSARNFCRGLLPDSEGDVAEMFRTQLADLDRIEQRLESILSPEQVVELRGKSAAAPTGSTYWDVNDHVTFHLEISPFPFNSHSASQIAGRLSTTVAQCSEEFAADGQMSLRVQGTESDEGWQPFTRKGQAKGYFVFLHETRLPPGRVCIDIRFDCDDEFAAGEYESWKIQVEG